MTDRVMPHSIEAEHAVLGAILLDNLRLGDVCDVVEAKQFYRSANQRVFAAMLQLQERHQNIDLLTLREELQRTGDFEDVGGAAYVAGLLDGVPRSSHIVEYARIVREKAALRDLVVAASRMLTRAYEARAEATEVLEEAEQAILGLADHSTSVGFEAMRTVAPRGMELLEKRCSDRQVVTGVPTGFSQLDDVTRGLQPGALIVVGARPGMGKTSFAINVAQHAASIGRVVGVYSLEMPNEELFFRQLAATARIDGHRLQSGFIGDREWGRVSEAFAAISESPLYVDETPAIGLFTVRSRARRLKAERGLDLLIIDYLQLMGVSGRQETRALEIGAITSGLKALAKELKVPILLLSQLNREMEKRGNRPRLSDLRDSGSIEQDADVVMFIHRSEDDQLADLIVAKHRNGPIGTVKLLWNDQQTRFETYDQQGEPEDLRLPMGDR